MQDLYFTEDGDITVDHNGDLALVTSPWRDYSQQAYLRLMTATSDFTMYPNIGADLDQLLGMPQTQETGEYGKQLILDSLNRDGAFTGIPVDIKAVPISLQTIRFDIFITVGSRTELILSIEQSLNNIQ